MESTLYHRGQDPKLLKLASLADLEERRDALIGLALDGPLLEDDLSERLAPLNAQIGELGEEAEDLRYGNERKRTTDEEERQMLRRLEAGLPNDLDPLTPEQWRGHYRKLGLKAMANSDGSITLRWSMNLELGVVRWENAETSTR